MPELRLADSDIADGEITFEAYCEKCGEGICHLTTGHTPRRGMPFIRVTPCETCMDNARFDAREEGRKTGYEEAHMERV